jgi:uncharacterized protein (DUF1684 family)
MLGEKERNGMRPKLEIALGLALRILMLSAPASGAEKADTAYRRELAQWRAEREAGLRKPDGWFSLVGLFWLDEGENRFGSDPAGKVVLPAGKAPAQAGVLVRRGNSVELKAAPEVALTLDDKPVSAATLRVGGEGKPQVVGLGSINFFLIPRGDRVGVRVRDSKNPALAAFRGLDYYPIAGDWRVEARFEPYRPPKPIPIVNVLGMVEDNPSPGAVVFQREGKSYRLEALDGGDGSLFVLFADATNGKETYGAGRFLDTDPPRNGKVVIDFNRAYNPPCAFSAYATCPLPPRQNRLPFAVRAGEKKYGTGHSGTP